MRINAEDLTQRVTQIFRKNGQLAVRGTACRQSLVQSNLKGHDSHGVGLVATYVRHFEDGLLVPNTAVDLVKDDGVIDV